MTAQSDNTTLTLVCATDRLARELRAAYNEKRREAGEQVWEKPSIFTLRGWLDSLWSASWPSEVVATPAQELAIWLDVVEASGAAEQVISPMGVARQARHAYSLALTHCMAGADVWAFGNPEHRSFVEWRAAFEGRCAQAGLVPRAALLGRLTRAVESGALPVAGPVRLEGWTSVPPHLERFITALGGRGVSVEVAEVGGACISHPAFWRPINAIEEVSAVAGAVRGLLDAAAQAGQGVPRIAVAVPELDAYRPRVEAALREALCPDRADGAVVPAEPWRFVRGQPLYLNPLAAAGLDALNLDRFDNDLGLLSRVLLSPFLWGGNGEERGRGDTDLRLRERGGRRYPISSVVRAGQRKDDPLTDTSARLEALAVELENRHSKASPTGWKDRFETRLAILGFPGRKSESSARFQAYNAFKEGLAELATLDVYSPALNEAQARHWLREIMVARPFEARVEYEQPIHVMQYEDLPGLKFDHVFVLGVTANALPKPRITSAFLDPAELERCVPAATAAGQLEQAKKLVDVLGSSAPSCTWVCPMYDDQGALCLPSSLIGPWPAETHVPARVESLVESVIAGGVQAILPDEDQVPPVVDAVAEDVLGGVSILANYAASPFIAFCRARLGLRSFPDEVGGLDARVQGNLVHAVLQRVWMELKDSDGLQGILSKPDQLAQLIERCVLAAAEDDGHLPEQFYGKALARMERTRLAALTRDWLAHEARRAHPFEVVCIEKETHAVIEGLPQRLRLDRVDRITAGGEQYYVAIDYKSGFSLPTSGWAPEALTEPQLPIYATYADLAELGIPRIDGIALAQVAEGKCGFRVWSNFTGRFVPDERGTLGKAVMDWERLRGEWGEWLAKAARGFMAGEAWLKPGALDGSPFTEDLRPFERSGVDDE